MQTLRRERKQKFTSILMDNWDRMLSCERESMAPIIAELLADAATSASERRTDEVWGEYDARPNIFKIYEENIGAITPILADELMDIEKRFPQEGWFLDATKEAVKKNVRNLKYIVAILTRWDTEGRGDNRKPAEETKPAPRIYDPSLEPVKNYIPAPENLRRHATG